jgi:predicted RNA-binding protein
MKKLILGATLLVSVATFAQKDELKTLKKIYAKDEISEKDLEAYKTANDALQALASEESDKVYAKFYKVMYPTVVLASKGKKATMQDQMGIYKPEFIKDYGEVINETLEFEVKSGKKIYSDDLIQEKVDFKKGLSTIAMNLNNASKFKEASVLFYSLYTFDPKEEGSSLQNAAQLAVSAKDYVLAEKLYEEFYNSDYFNNGVSYFAFNKANGIEQNFGSSKEAKDLRTSYISKGIFEKPRDEKVNKSKGDVLRALSILIAQNEGDKKKLEMYVTEARKLLPNDQDLLITEFNLYFNQGYELIKDDMKMVEEINKVTNDKKKYDDLVAKRKEIFTKALPFFEKAYQIKPSDENAKNVLKITYENLGQTEKAKAIN